MPIAQAMWVHGHSIGVEHPERLASVWRAGFFARLQGKPAQSAWFHFAVPTPVIVAGSRLRVGSVLVRLRATPAEAWLSAVHVYDGERKIAAHDGLRLAPERWSTPRFAVPGSPEVLWGLGISLQVTFARDSTAPNADLARRLDFSAAGCDFL